MVETFGFFLVNLDIREESTKHSQVISALVKQINNKDQNKWKYEYEICIQIVNKITGKVRENERFGVKQIGKFEA